MKRCFSLKRNKDFRQVYRRGESKANPKLVLIYKKNHKGGIHVGISASKKLGNSVVRNRVKRRLRESFSPVIPRVKDGYDFIFIAREPIVDAKFTDIGDAVLNLLRRADLLKKEEKRL